MDVLRNDRRVSAGRFDPAGPAIPRSDLEEGKKWVEEDPGARKYWAMRDKRPSTLKQRFQSGKSTRPVYDYTSKSTYQPFSIPADPEIDRQSGVGSQSTGTTWSARPKHKHLHEQYQAEPHEFRVGGRHGPKRGESMRQWRARTETSFMDMSHDEQMSEIQQEHPEFWRM